MVSPSRGQPTVANARASTNKNNHNNTNTKSKNLQKSNNNRNKGQGVRRQVEPEGLDRGGGGVRKDDVGDSEAGHQERRVVVPAHLPPTGNNKAVDAKEVEKLLQEALWKGSHHQKKRTEEDCDNGGNSGGCDTGYSSRCSTPPSPPSPQGDHTPPPPPPPSADTKQGTKRHLEVPASSSSSSSSVVPATITTATTTTVTATAITTTTTARDSRSQSPSSSTSSGSYCNPRQKRRNSIASNGSSNGNNNNSFYNNKNQHQHHPHHHHNHHQPNHHVKYHNNHYHHNNHDGEGNYFRDNWFAGDNGPFFNQHHYPESRRGGYNNYHHNNHHNHHQNRKYNQYGDGGYNNYHHEPFHYQQHNNYHQYHHNQHHHQNYLNPGGDYPRYNGEWGPGYQGRNHHTNKPHGNYSERNRGKENQTRVLSDRAGSFSEVTEEQEQENKSNVNSVQWQCEVVDTPEQLISGCEWDQLSQQVWDTFKRHQQTNKTFDKKIKLKEKIFKLIRTVLPRCRLYVVGSSLSGFGADCSDVDMCLILTPHDMDQRTEAVTVLKFLQRQLNTCGSWREMELIRAKVPILKFRDVHSQVDVDLNCNNTVGIRNTHLLNSYSQLDWRVRPLTLVVKLWAQHHNINNAKDMTISSYSLVLMVIHFLQQGTSPPVLPCLHRAFPDKFRSHDHIASIPITEKMPPFTSNNKDSLGQLFHGFLNYFANKFTFIEETISVRTGGTVPTEQCRSVLNSKNNAHMWKYLCIEEPFDLTNTARSVYDETVFEHVRKVFAKSFKLLDEKRDLSEVLKA